MNTEEKRSLWFKESCSKCGLIGYTSRSEQGTLSKKYLCNECTLLNKITCDLEEAYNRGFVDGVTKYAWWRDGTQYVGTCGITLKDAVKDYVK